jgi:hypothetical protein
LVFALHNQLQMRKHSMMHHVCPLPTKLAANRARPATAMGSKVHVWHGIFKGAGQHAQEMRQDAEAFGYLALRREGCF